MSFYSKLEFNQKELNRIYTVSVAGRTYRMDTNTADIKFDNDNLLIFTTPENYRVAVNVSRIDVITWVVNGGEQD